VDECKLLGEDCGDAMECCSGLCDIATDKCAGPGSFACTADGDDCEASIECCSGSFCDGGTCATGACVSDNDACNNDTECCGNSCVDNECAPLNFSCRTGGNECTDNFQCCSAFCNDGICDPAASFCRQDGDICQNNYECCSSDCEVADGASVGTCGPVQAGATRSCWVSGTLCQDPGGNVDPDACKECCTSLCGPWANGKPQVCLPASGCRVVGELCSRNEDCCGGDPESGLPGAGNTLCLKSSPDEPIGVCRNPMGCLPQGEVCKYTGASETTCDGVNAQSNNCCTKVGFSGSKSTACQLDTVGVPRCDGLGGECRPEGETCSNASDCCGNLPCVPDNSGVLRCTTGGGDPDGDGGLPACIAEGETCSFTGDCCRGLLCNLSPGSSQGVCEPPDDPPPGTDPPPSCSLFGQGCSGSNECCEGLACSPSLDVCTVGG
jgi:hypothetical protein